LKLHDFLKNHFFAKKSKKKVKIFGKKNPSFKNKNPKKSKKNPHGFLYVTIIIVNLKIFFLCYCKLKNSCKKEFLKKSKLFSAHEKNKNHAKKLFSAHKKKFQRVVDFPF
jgi:hypothetical protein